MDDFNHLHRLAELLDVGPVEIRASPDDCTVLFFTEYGLSESLVGSAASRFDGLPPGKHTPDLVVLITKPTPVLLAVEAKLYDRPSTTDLRRQLDAQNRLLTVLACGITERLGQDVHLAHVALLPEGRVDAGALGYPVITWEQVQAAFADVAPRYFDAMLTAALQRYPEPASRRSGNQDAELTGAELVRRYLDGDDTYSWMGRGRGIRGPLLSADLEAGRWRTFTYQCREKALPENPNWFSVADFVDLLRTCDALW